MPRIRSTKVAAAGELRRLIKGTGRRHTGQQPRNLAVVALIAAVGATVAACGVFDGDVDDADGYIGREVCEARLPGQYAALKAELGPFLEGDIYEGEGCDSGGDGYIEFEVQDEPGASLKGLDRDIWRPLAIADAEDYRHAEALTREHDGMRFEVFAGCDTVECVGSADVRCEPDRRCLQALPAASPTTG